MDQDLPDRRLTLLTVLTVFFVLVAHVGLALAAAMLVGFCWRLITGEVVPQRVTYFAAACIMLIRLISGHLTEDSRHARADLRRMLQGWWPL